MFQAIAPTWQKWSTLSLIATLTVAAAAEGNSFCAQSVQGRIAWNTTGNTSWSPSNVARLCAGAEDSEEPARCFEAALEIVEAGVAWTWQEAVELCAGARDASLRIRCYRETRDTGVAPAAARERCWRTAVLPDAPPPYTGPPIVSDGPLRPLDRATTWRESSTSFSHATRVARSAVSQPLGPVAALSGFEIRFHESDHKIRHIAVLADGTFAEVAFNDNDGEDIFRGMARWAVFSRGVGGEVEAAAGGRVDLPLEPGPASSTLVLTGFAFRRASDTDANVRMIGIRLDPEDLVARVWLIDDQGTDFRDVARMIGFSALGGLFLPPLGSFVGGAASAPAASPAFRPYVVKVQYAWIPNDVVLRESSRSGSHAFNVDDWLPEGPVALQGFEFAFGNSDHHLGGLGVTLGAEHHHVLFRDDGWDDPIQWAVSYAVLRPERRR